MLTLARPWGWRCSQNSGQIPGLARGADLEKARCSQYNTHHHLLEGNMIVGERLILRAWERPDRVWG